MNFYVIFVSKETHQILIPFKLHNFSSLKQVMMHFLQMQSNLEWSLLNIGGEKLHCFILHKQIS